MKGIYVLILKVKKSIKIKIGALGKIKFPKGSYAYVGSAQNNLEKRVARHLKKRKIKFWHIDYLLANKNVKINRIMYKSAGKSEECRIAQFLSNVEKPVKGFGSSDCKCESHLFRLKRPLLVIEGMREL